MHLLELCKSRYVKDLRSDSESISFATQAFLIPFQRYNPLNHFKTVDTGLQIPQGSKNILAIIQILFQLYLEFVKSRSKIMGQREYIISLTVILFIILEGTRAQILSHENSKMQATLRN